MDKEGKPRDIDKPYRKKQLESFAYVDTKPEEWRACDVTGVNQATGEIVSIDAPSTYKPVKPISDRLPADQLAELEARIEASEYGEALCELCGAVVKYPKPIAHDGKGLIMYIGSECIKNYTKAGRQYVQKKKEFIDKQVREDFIKWIPKAVQEVWRKGLDSERHFKPRYYKLKEALEAARDDPDALTARKMLNLFKKAHKFGLSVPSEYLPK